MVSVEYHRASSRLRWTKPHYTNDSLLLNSIFASTPVASIILSMSLAFIIRLPFSMSLNCWAVYPARDATAVCFNPFSSIYSFRLSATTLFDFLIVNLSSPPFLTSFLLFVTIIQVSCFVNTFLQLSCYFSIDL